jgi:hypothetical protein
MGESHEMALNINAFGLNAQARDGEACMKSFDVYRVVLYRRLKVLLYEEKIPWRFA